MEENKNISATIRRAERFQVILIGEGIIVGGDWRTCSDLISNDPWMRRGLAE